MIAGVAPSVRVVLFEGEEEGKGAVHHQLKGDDH
jgi:hypothetical protein